MDEEAARAQMELEALRKKKRAKMQKERAAQRAARKAAQEAEEAEVAAEQHALKIAQFKRTQEVKRINLEARRNMVYERRAKKMAHGQEIAEALMKAASADVAKKKLEAQELAARHERLARQRAERQALQSSAWKADCERWLAICSAGSLAAERLSTKMMQRKEQRVLARTTAAEARALARVAECQGREMSCNTLWDAVSFGDVSCSRFEGLLEKAAADTLGGMSAAVRLRDAHMDTLLHKAASNGGLKVVRTLLAKGADPCAIGTARLRITPLHEAAAHGYTTICDALLRAGADVFAVDSSGCTALHAAARGGHRGVATALLLHATTVDDSVGNGDAGLRLAQMKNWRGQTAADVCHPMCGGNVRQLLQVDYAEKLRALALLAPTSEKKQSNLPSIF